MKRYLLDTNHLGEAIGRVSIVRDRIQQLSRQGDLFGACVPVLCELLVGVVVRKDATKARRRLDGLLQVIRLWPIDLPIADRYAEAYHELQKAGRALSQVDILLAALARHLNATLLTSGCWHVFTSLRSTGTLKTCRHTVFPVHAIFRISSPASLSCLQ